MSLRAQDAGPLLLSEWTGPGQRHERRFPTTATRPVRLMRALKGARQRLGRLFRELRQVRRGARREAHETCTMAERGSLSLDGAAALICKAEFPWQIRGSLKWYGQPKRRWLAEDKEEANTCYQ